MANIALLGDIVVSVYICEGMLRWHRHIDTDELFWVHEGAILLESERGDLRLNAGDLAVVPKGVSHRTQSDQRASVILLRCGFLPDRKNGQRRLYSTEGDPELESFNPRLIAQEIDEPFLFRTVARIENALVQVARGEGSWSSVIPSNQEAFLGVLEGSATVRTANRMLHMHSGDFTVAPGGSGYSLSSTYGTALVWVTRKSER